MSKELQSQKETSPNCLGTIFGGSCTVIKRRNSYTQGSKTRKHSSANDSLQMPSLFLFLHSPCSSCCYCCCCCCRSVSLIVQNMPTLSNCRCSHRCNTEEASELECALLMGSVMLYLICLFCGKSSPLFLTTADAEKANE